MQSLNSSSNFKHRTLKGYLGVGVTAAGLDKLQEAVPGQEDGGSSVPVAGDSLQAVRSVAPLSADCSVQVCSVKLSPLLLLLISSLPLDYCMGKMTKNYFKKRLK